MAILTITELKDIGFDSYGNAMPSPKVPGEFEQFVAIGAVSVPCTFAFKSTTRYIMVNTDLPVFLAFGVAPVALPNLHRLGQNETRFYQVDAGSRIAVLQA